MPPFGPNSQHRWLARTESRYSRHRLQSAHTQHTEKIKPSIQDRVSTLEIYDPSSTTGTTGQPTGVCLSLSYFAFARKNSLFSKFTAASSHRRRQKRLQKTRPLFSQKVFADMGLAIGVRLTRVCAVTFILANF